MVLAYPRHARLSLCSRLRHNLSNHQPGNESKWELVRSTK